jgi:methanethiol S-methyltransferase
MEYFILAILWITFCVLHSSLISITFTRFLRHKSGDYYRYHRLVYNIFSIVILIPVVIYSLSIKQEPFFAWNGYLLPVKYLLLFTGILFFVMGAKHYSAAQFIGSAQIKDGTKHILLNKSGKLSSSGILGVVRHPFYAGTFPLLWSNDLDITALIINIILSIYVLIGTLLEERKLIAEFGDAYRKYQQKVSMLFPLKWIEEKLRLKSILRSGKDSC